MNKVFYLLLLLSLSACQHTNTPKITTILAGDSGYLAKKDLLPYILSEKLLDTSGTSQRWNELQDSTIIGKYYKNERNYIICINNLSDAATSVILCETNHTGHIGVHTYYGQSLAQSSCTGIGISGFGKMQDYYFIRSCVWGSLYAGSELTFFKNVLPQETLNSIPESSWRGLVKGDTSIYRELQATIHISHDSINAHYAIIQEIEKVPAGPRTARETIDSFDVVYLMKDKQWIATDSAKITLYRN